MFYTNACLAYMFFVKGALQFNRVSKLSSRTARSHVSKDKQYMTTQNHIGWFTINHCHQFHRCVNNYFVKGYVAEVVANDTYLLNSM